ncbi:MAG: TfoX/Sxy family protein [Pseudomonadota bacterium]
MSASAEYLAFIRDHLSGLGPITTRRMFGGAGVFLGDAMFGLVADDTLYLRTDADLAEALASEGSEAFTYTGQAKPITLPYWRLPDAALDDPDEALAWARRALVPAEAAAAEKRAAKARKAARKALGDRPKT